jgi:hypothetical protein
MTYNFIGGRMKKVLCGLIMLISLTIISSTSWCEEQAVKYNQVMIGSHSIIIDNNISGAEEDEFSGFMIGYQRNITKNIAIRGCYFSDEHDNVSEIEASGIEAQILFGNNFINNGFYAYGGLGYFNEEWEYSGIDIDLDFKGILLSLGLGYKWDQVVLDFIINVRDPSDYEDQLNSA